MAEKPAEADSNEPRDLSGLIDFQVRFVDLEMPPGAFYYWRWRRPLYRIGNTERVLLGFYVGTRGWLSIVDTSTGAVESVKHGRGLEGFVQDDENSGWVRGSSGLQRIELSPLRIVHDHKGYSGTMPPSLLDVSPNSLGLVNDSTTTLVSKLNFEKGRRINTPTDYIVHGPDASTTLVCFETGKARKVDANLKPVGPVLEVGVGFSPTLVRDSLYLVPGMFGSALSVPTGENLSVLYGATRTSFERVNELDPQTLELRKEGPPIVDLQGVVGADSSGRLIGVAGHVFEIRDLVIIDPSDLSEIARYRLPEGPYVGACQAGDDRIMLQSGQATNAALIVEWGVSAITAEAAITSLDDFLAAQSKRPRYRTPKKRIIETLGGRVVTKYTNFDLSDIENRDGERMIFEDIEAQSCRLDHCDFYAPKNPEDRVVIRRASLRNIQLSVCYFEGFFLDEVAIHSLSNGREWRFPAFCFRHVTLTGRFGQIIVPSSSIDESDFDREMDEEQRTYIYGIRDRHNALALANEAMYADMDWAIDIRGATFNNWPDFRSIPEHLVIRNDDQGVIFTDEDLWRELDQD